MAYACRFSVTLNLKPLEAFASGKSALPEKKNGLRPQGFIHDLFYLIDAPNVEILLYFLRQVFMVLLTISAWKTP